MKSRWQGFTLIELLVVMAILGILLSIATPSYLKSHRNAQLSQGAQEFATQVDRARAEARRTNRCFRLQVLGGKTGAYKISKYMTATCTDDVAAIESTQVYDMAPGTTMTVTPASTTNTVKVDFRPPYGINTTGLPIDLQISHLADATVKKDLRVTGVMGTVIIK